MNISTTPCSPVRNLVSFFMTDFISPCLYILLTNHVVKKISHRRVSTIWCMVYPIFAGIVLFYLIFSIFKKIIIKLFHYKKRRDLLGLSVIIL